MSSRDEAEVVVPRVRGRELAEDEDRAAAARDRRVLDQNVVRGARAALAVDLQRGLLAGAAVEGDAVEGEVCRTVEHDRGRELDAAEREVVQLVKRRARHHDGVARGRLDEDGRAELAVRDRLVRVAARVQHDAVARLGGRERARERRGRAHVDHRGAGRGSGRPRASARVGPAAADIGARVDDATAGPRGACGPGNPRGPRVARFAGGTRRTRAARRGARTGAARARRATQTCGPAGTARGRRARTAPTEYQQSCHCLRGRLHGHTLLIGYRGHSRRGDAKKITVRRRSASRHITIRSAVAENSENRLPLPANMSAETPASARCSRPPGPQSSKRARRITA